MSLRIRIYESFLKNMYNEYMKKPSAALHQRIILYIIWMEEGKI